METQDITVFFKSLLPTCDCKSTAESNTAKTGSLKELFTSGSKLPQKIRPKKGKVLRTCKKITLIQPASYTAGT